MKVGLDGQINLNPVWTIPFWVEVFSFFVSRDLVKWKRIG